ncbi:hypothetical protein LLH00_11595 [bacterium]|nr:hypothetical protein [bacterium]
MLKWLNRVRNLLVLLVIGSGLADVLLESWLGAALSVVARLTLRSVFWVASLLWLALMIHARAARARQTDPDSK